MENRQRIPKAIAESPFDVVILNSAENFYYTSGTRIMTMTTLHDRPAMTVWPKDSEPYILVCTTEALHVQQESWITQVREYTYRRQSYIEELGVLLEDLDLAKSTIGIEKGRFSLRDGETLQKRLPMAKLLDCQNLFDDLRMIKAPGEIASLRKASAAADGAILEAFQFAEPGVTERQIGEVLQRALITRGAETVPFLVVGTGPRSGLAHPYAGWPSDRVLQSGDLIRVDVGGNFDFYWSDNMRNAVVGQASQEQREHWKRAWDVQQLVIEAVRPGITASELAEVGRQAYDRVGAPTGLGFVGHGIGLSLHEPPVLEVGNEQVLQPGMVLCIETDIWPSENEAYDSEDQVLVTENGYEILSRTYDWQELFIARRTGKRS